MPKNRFLSDFEPFLLYFILYFPSLSAGNKGGNIYTDPNVLLFYTALSALQIIFLVYFVNLKKTEREKSGFKKADFSSAVHSAIYAAALILIISAVNIILDIFISSGEDIRIKKTFFFILQAAGLSLLTGYREEIFFRSYLISSFEKNQGKSFSIIISSLLFAVSHISAGARGIISAFAAGLFLALIFFKHRNIHINALAHSFYNFSVLIFSF